MGQDPRRTASRGACRRSGRIAYLPIADYGADRGHARPPRSSRATDRSTGCACPTWTAPRSSPRSSMPSAAGVLRRARRAGAEHPRLPRRNGGPADATRDGGRGAGGDGLHAAGRPGDRRPAPRPARPAPGGGGGGCAGGRGLGLPPTRLRQERAAAAAARARRLHVGGRTRSPDRPVRCPARSRRRGHRCWTRAAEHGRAVRRLALVRLQRRGRRAGLRPCGAPPRTRGDLALVAGPDGRHRLRRPVPRGGDPQPRHVAPADIQPVGGGHRRAHHLASRGDRGGAQLRLPLLLAARCVVRARRLCGARSDRGGRRLLPLADARDAALGARASDLLHGLRPHRCGAVRDRHARGLSRLGARTEGQRGRAAASARRLRIGDDGLDRLLPARRDAGRERAAAAAGDGRRGDPEMVAARQRAVGDAGPARSQYLLEGDVLGGAGRVRRPLRNRAHGLRPCPLCARARPHSEERARAGLEPAAQGASRAPTVATGSTRACR